MKVKINNVNIRNILKNIGLFRVSKRNNKVLTFDDFFNIIDQNKDNDEIIYEILPDETDKEKEAKEYILNLHLDKERELFFLNQIQFKSGIYSYKDLYKLVNYYLNKLSKENIPYKNIYPIIIDDKTYIDNIALFIACLKLDLKPALIDKNFITKIDEYYLNPKERGIYICSSGSGFQKLIPINFDEILKNFANDRTEHGSKKRVYSTNPIKGISGLLSNILMPIVLSYNVIVDKYSTKYFERLNSTKSNICFLPINYYEYINDNFYKLAFSHLERAYFGGGVLDYNTYLKLGNLKSKIVYVYGKTEACGYILSTPVNEDNLIRVPIELLLVMFSSRDDSRKYFDYILQPLLNKIITNTKTATIKARQMTNNVLGEMIFKYNSIPFMSSGVINSRISIDNSIWEKIKKRIKDNFEMLNDDDKYFVNNFVLKSDFQFGEIKVDGVLTDDIGIVYENNLYVISRKEKIDFIIKYLIRIRLGVDCQIIKMNGKNVIVIENRNLSDRQIVNIYEYFLSNKKFFNMMHLEIMPLFSKLLRSNVLQKVIKMESVDNAVGYNISDLSKSDIDIELGQDKDNIKYTYSVFEFGNKNYLLFYGIGNGKRKKSILKKCKNLIKKYNISYIDFPPIQRSEFILEPAHLDFINEIEFLEYSMHLQDEFIPKGEENNEYKSKSI